jgi:hypothetical protein
VRTAAVFVCAKHDQVMERQLAQAVLSLADSAGMPDSFWETDSRVALARQVLGVPQDGRYSHAHLWSNSDAAT